MDYRALAEHLQPKFPHQLAERVEIEQMFTLIDSLLSVEICLHHQVLPLFLEGSRLHLGMVFPDDRIAQDYTQQIASYLNYSLVSESIPAAALQASLSAYLKYSRAAAGRSPGRRTSPRTRPKRPQSAPPPQDPTPATPPAAPVPPKASEPEPEAKTYVLDTPTYLDSMARERDRPAPSPEVTQSTLRISKNVDRGVDENTGEDTGASPVAQPAAPVLALDTRYPQLPFEQLRNLLPRYLLPELIGRALAGNIGRLYFEAQEQQGRILLSDNGIVRSAIDNLSREQLCGVLNELKQLMQLPMVANTPSQRAELEYTYGGNSVLLRVRITKHRRGERASLQVLQGASLKFYQRQKLLRTGQEAIDAAKQVQLRVSEFSSRLPASSRVPRATEPLLKDLAQILQGLSAQVKALQLRCAPGAEAPESPAEAPTDSSTEESAD